MDMEEFREPVEVYEAANGNGEPLAQRIESGARLNDWERFTLAAFLRGDSSHRFENEGRSDCPTFITLLMMFANIF